MNDNLQQALEDQKQQTKQEVQSLPGMLGIPLGGQKRVEVPERNSYVYVRLRSNQSEVIQAFNNKVAPAYNLPVLVERQGNRYVVTSVDTQRYENNWSSFAPFLPRHGNTHSFDTESGGGGDIVWVYPRQFMPSLVLPSGSAGASSVFIAPYTLQKPDGSWIYTGNTGTQSLLTYRPSSPTGAVIALVYLDALSGNPGVVINSGTVFSNSITGSSQIFPYIPSLTGSNRIPLAAVRLITGTNAISWDNLYDLRQFIHAMPTGTGGGGGNLDSTYLRLDASNVPLTGALEINYTGTGTSVPEYLRIYRNGSGAGQPFDRPAILVQDNFDPARASHLTGGLLKFYDFFDELLVHLNPYASGTADSYILDTTNYVSPLGTLLSLRNQGNVKFTVNGTGTVNIQSGATYNIGGSPHAHGEAVSNSNDVFRCDSAGISTFVGTINGAPSGANVTYNVTSGNENVLVPNSTSQLAKMRLYNTTRGTYALISNCNTTTNVITLTTNAPAGWTSGDTITIASQTVTDFTIYKWIDLEITGGELLNKSFIMMALYMGDSAGAGYTLAYHPFETYGAGKIGGITTQSTSTIGGVVPYKLVSNIITIAWNASGAATATSIIREAGYIR